MVLERVLSSPHANKPEVIYTGTELRHSHLVERIISRGDYLDYFYTLHTLTRDGKSLTIESKYFIWDGVDRDKIHPETTRSITLTLSYDVERFFCDLVKSA
jgi:hypothetical protein